MANENAVVVINTRITSRRLPGKALLKIAGVPALEHILRRIPPELPVIVAVPRGESHIFSPHISVHPKAQIYCGYDESPLHRMHYAVKELHRDAKFIVRITHDDILIDGQEMLALLQKAEQSNSGYALSDGILEGAGVEVFRRENLEHAAMSNAGPIEHISYFIHGKEMPFPNFHRFVPRPSIVRDYRLTMDYPKDAIVLEAILRHLGPMATTDAICEFIDRNRHIMNLNRLPELSVYTCVHNAEKYIGDCISSVMNAQIPNMEYIIVEDSSTDETLEKIIPFVDVYRQSAKINLIVLEKNVGLASASNVAIANARGRYVMRIDADDILLPGNAVTEMIETMKQGLSAVVYPDYYVMLEPDRWIEKTAMPGNVFHHAGGALMDKRLLNEIRFRDGLKNWDSIDLYKRIKNRFPISYYSAPSFVYRKHPISMSRPSTKRQEDFQKLKSEWTLSGGTVTSADITWPPLPPIS